MDSIRGKPRSRIIWNILNLFAGLSLIYYAWILFDLVTHPFNPGSNAGSIPFLFRWLSAACGTFGVVIAVFILRKVRNNLNGFLLLIFSVGAASWSMRIDYEPLSFLNFILILQTFYFFFFCLPALSALLLHFPDGQVYPEHLSGWAWLLIISQGIAGTLAMMGVLAFEGIPNPIFIPELTPIAETLNTYAVTVPLLVGVASLIFRYRSGGERVRAQIKWLLWLAALAVSESLILAFIYPARTDKNIQSLFLILSILSYLYWQVFPALAIGIALLRHRLWDIDIIIRKTLQYSLLTATLGLLYFGSVVILRQILSSTAGESSISIVLSTLLIAALFESIRRRVQLLIDRSFYRQKYDASRSIQEFTNAARQEVELSQLQEQLVKVVEKTMQPAGVILWTRKTPTDMVRMAKDRS